MKNKLIEHTFILVFLCQIYFLLFPITAKGYELIRKQSNGFVWVEKLEGENRKGAEDVAGNVLIPVDSGYNFIYYNEHTIYTGFFRATKKKGKQVYKALYNLNGDLIIPSNRGYNEVFIPATIDIIDGKSKSPDGKWYIRNYPGFFYVSKKKKWGICDLNGNEIVPIKYRKDDLLYNSNNGEFYVKNKSIGVILNLCKDQHNKLIEIGQMALNHSNLPAETQLIVENTGYEWVKTNRFGFYGANVNGKEIIPVTSKWMDVRYMGLIKNSKKITDSGCFIVKNQKGKIGVYSLNGDKLIRDEFIDIQFVEVDEIGGYFICSKSLDARKYAYTMSGKSIKPIGGYSNFDAIKFKPLNGHIGYFEIERGEKFGVCDIYGNSISTLESYPLKYGEKGFYGNDNKYIGVQLSKKGKIDKSLQVQWEAEEKEARRAEQAQRWTAAIGGALVSAANAYSQFQVAKAQQQPSYLGGTVSSNGSVAERMSQPGYFQQAQQQLLSLSVSQVLQEEMLRYQQAREAHLQMTGKDLSLEEFRLQEGAAIMALKEQGIDLVAEQNERNRQNRQEFRESLDADRKQKLQNLKEYNAARYGVSTSSSPSTMTSSRSKSSSTTSHTSSSSISSKYNSSKSSSSVSSGTHSFSAGNTNNDSHQQFKSGNLNSSSSDYTYKQKVTLYRANGSSYVPGYPNVELYEKGATLYVKIGNGYHPASPSASAKGFSYKISFGATPYYFNK